MKTTLFALITLLLAATAPAQESIQNQLDEIAANQRAAEDAAGVDRIQRQGEADARQSFRDCVEAGILSPPDCASMWLPGK